MIFKLKLKNIDLKNNTYIKSWQSLKNFWKYYFRNEISEYCKRVIPSEYSEWFFIAKFKKECTEYSIPKNEKEEI